MYMHAVDCFIKGRLGGRSGIARLGRYDMSLYAPFGQIATNLRRKLAG